MSEPRYGQPPYGLSPFAQPPHGAPPQPGASYPPYRQSGPGGWAPPHSGWRPPPRRSLAWFWYQNCRGQSFNIALGNGRFTMSAGEGRVSSWAKDGPRSQTGTMGGSYSVSGNQLFLTPDQVRGGSVTTAPPEVWTITKPSEESFTANDGTQTFTMGLCDYSGSRL